MMHAISTVAKALGMTRKKRSERERKERKERTVEDEHDITKHHHGCQQSKEHKVLSRFTQPITRHD